jgi:hypothetical protein
MKTLPFVLLFASAMASGQEVRVDGEGYMRLALDGKVVFAKSGTLRITNGRLGIGNATFLPAIPVPAGTRLFVVGLDGTISCEGSSACLGQLVLAMFDAGAPTGTEGLLSAAGRPKLTNPGEGAAGVIRMAGGPSPSSAPQRLVAEPSTGKGIEIRLKVAAEVSGEKLVLGDVCDVQGPTTLQEALSRLDLGPAPVLGRSKSIERNSLVSKLRGAGYRPENLLILGAGPIVVTRAADFVPAQQFVDVAQKAALESLGSGWKLTLAQESTDFVVPKGATELRATNVSQRSDEIAVTVEVWVSGKRFNSRTVKFNAVAPPEGVKAGTKVHVQFRKGDLMVEADGIAQKTVSIGGTVDVLIRMGTDKTQDSVHTGTVIAPGVVEVKF